MPPTFTIGIEEEYQTIDPVTRDLRSHIQVELLEKGQLDPARTGEGGRCTSLSSKSGLGFARTLRKPKRK